MTEEARNARKEYFRKYYQDHKEEHKKRCEDYWERKASGEIKEKVTVHGEKYDVERLKNAFILLCNIFNNKSNEDAKLAAAYEGMRLISNYINVEDKI